MRMVITQRQRIDHLKWQQLLVIFLLLFSTSWSEASDDQNLISGFSREEALLLGEQIYRRGILPSGQPVRAVVMGDIPVDGRMFTCDDCHQRSGLGSVEGTIITWPTNGRELYVPRRKAGAFKPPSDEVDKQNARRNLPGYWQMEDARPAYSDESLAYMLRKGVDPAGRTVDPVMPKFRLKHRDMDLLIHYLKNLSSDLSPGVDDTTLKVATVIGEHVPEEKKAAMLSVLQAHIDASNSQSRHQERRAASGPFYKSEKHKAYRKLQLNIWELKGEESSWGSQLESYYSQEPVFALLGGITEEGWGPIHRFSEENKIPCIFPITDLPELSESDWYTLYFSKGFYQEGESAAKYVRTKVGAETDIRVVQFFRQGPEAVALARGFEETWGKMGGKPTENQIITEEGKPDELLLHALAESEDPVVVLLWVGQEDAVLLKNPVLQTGRSTMIFTSASLLEEDFSSIGDGLRDSILVTYPYALPQQYGKRRDVVKRWLQARKIPLTDFTIQAKMYFLGWMLPGALKSMRSEFFREYFLEGFDMMIDQDYAIAVYPRLTFGPGQRYASKGCYIVKLTKGHDPELIPVNDWVTY